MNAVSGWTLALEVPKTAADIFDRALAPISVATSAFKIEGSELWRIEAFAVERPDENAVVGAVALAAGLAGNKTLQLLLMQTNGRRHRHYHLPAMADVTGGNSLTIGGLALPTEKRFSNSSSSSL